MIERIAIAHEARAAVLGVGDVARVASQQIRVADAGGELVVELKHASCTPNI